MTHLVVLNADYTTLGLYPAVLSGSSFTVVTKSVLVETVGGIDHLFVRTPAAVGTNGRESTGPVGTKVGLGFGFPL